MSKRRELLMLEVPHLSVRAFRPIGGRMILCDGGGDGGGGGGSADVGPSTAAELGNSFAADMAAAGYSSSPSGDGVAAAQAQADAQSAAAAQAAAQAQAAQQAANEAAAQAQAEAQAQATAQAQAAAEAAMAQAAAEALAASNELGYGQLGEQSDFGDVGAISAAQNAIANNALTQSQAVAAANALSKGTGMNPVDALMAVTGAYGTANPSDISGPMHSSGISYADIAVAQALGLGNQDVNSGQTVNQAMAAANVHQAMPGVIGTIFGMAGSPMLGQFAKGIAQIGMGQTTLGGLISSMGLNALAAQLGVPASFVSLLASTDLGKAAVSDLANTIDTALAGGLIGTGTTDTGSTSIFGSDSGAGGSGSDLTQDVTGYEIAPVPTDWKSPTYNMAFTPDTTNLFPDLPAAQKMQSAASRITAPNQYQLSDVINTLNYQSVPFTSPQYQMPAMQQRDMSAYNDIIGGIDGQQVSINDIINSIGKTQMPAFGMSNIVGNLQGSPVSIGDIISGIQSQYGQTPTSAMG